MIFANKRYLAKRAYVSYLMMVTLMTQIASCAIAPWEKPIDQSKTPEVLVAEVKKEVIAHPEATVKRKNLLVTQELATTQLLVQAEQAKSKGLNTEASALYDRVLSFLPEDPVAFNGKLQVERELGHLSKLDQAATMLDSKPESAKDIVRDVLIENPQHAKAIDLQQQINTKLAPVRAKPAELKTLLNKPVTLELRDVNIKVAFEALSRATGINFILDKDIKPETKATIFIKKARIEDAIDMVLSSNGLQKKVLSENTVLVFPGTPAKLKDYQDLMIRSFYFSNASAKQVSILIKTMLKTKDIFVDERLNMMVMRDTPEVIRIAEKLVAANDLEDPEVMLDIEVLEVSRSRLQELGIVYPNQLAVLSAANLTLEALKSVKSPNIGVSPNPGVNFKKTIGDVNLLSNPRIRVRNNEKAKIMVGDKVPIITTTSTANVGISENISYVDVGLKLDVEPRITLNDFVNIKVGLEVSSLGEKTTTRNGATAYTIGTRNANTVLRLKNGETQILAGLILDDERKNASRLPGLGDIPLLGRLFSNQEDRRSKTEIVLAITPRIIGNISLPNAEVSEYWSGTENLITDKPQNGLPVSSGALSAKEQFRERIRQPQLRLNPEAATESGSASEQELATQSQSTPVEEVAAVPPASQEVVQPSGEPIAPSSLP
ncbi:MAG: secretin and TonB N-terminal domain-containing protein [Methylotenera sp.]|nr:secretin and TonB N-terminal domain-containing protein [Methylotenera sp.]